MAYNHLIIIPCHGIWKGSDNENSNVLGEDRDEWFLASFQIEGQDHLCFKDHLTKGYDILHSDPESILIISGGRTKAESELSEAQSYYNLLQKLKPTDNRTVLEEFARDSFENVIFSICRFYEVAGSYPERITIVGFEFKRSRFLKNHLAQALAFPVDQLQYVGNAPTPTKDIEAYFQDLHDSEYKHAVRYFESDYYGTFAPLSTKKSTRNPYGLHHDYKKTNPALKTFLESIEDGKEKTTEEIKSLLLESAPWIVPR